MGSLLSSFVHVLLTEVRCFGLFLLLLGSNRAGLPHSGLADGLGQGCFVQDSTQQVFIQPLCTMSIYALIRWMCRIPEDRS